MAALHTTTATLTHILFNLAYHPECVRVLCEEFRTVLKDCGGLNKTAIAQLRKMDSFMKGSVRISPATLTVFRHLILKDVTLSDGTLFQKAISLKSASPSATMTPTSGRMRRVLRGCAFSVRTSRSRMRRSHTNPPLQICIINTGVRVSTPAQEEFSPLARLKRFLPRSCPNTM